MNTSTPDLTTQQLIDGLDHVAFFSAHVPGLKVDGHLNAKCKCPFECGDDHSFSFEQEKGVYLCHRCKAKGSAWGFLEAKGYGPAQIRSTLVDYQRNGTFRPSPTILRETKPENERRRFVAIPETTQDGATKTTEYEYTLDNGAGSAVKVRYAYPPGGKRDKTFRWYERDGAGFLDTLGGKHADLYQLEAVKAGIERGALIVLNEGEKACDRLARHDGDDTRDFVATCGHAGKSSFNREHGEWFAAQLAGARDVLVVVDRDADGDRWAEDVRRHLESKVLSLRFVRSAVTTNKADLYDHLEAGHSLADLAPMEPGETTTKALEFELASAVLGREIPKPTPIIEGALWPGDIGLGSGAGGVGKTWILQDLSIALASGRPAFGHLRVNAPVRVAFLDLESRAWEIDLRVNRLAGAAGLANLLLIRERIRLDRPEDVRRLKTLIESEGLAFVIVDSLRRAIAGDINKSEVVNALFVDVLDPIRVETGCGFLLSAHTRKRTGELDLDTPDQAMSGTVDLRNMSDLHFGVEARDGNLAIVPTKTRHGALPEPFLVALDGLSGDDDGPVTVRYVGAVDKASDKVQDAILALLDDAGEAGMLRGEIIGRAGYSARAVDSAIAALKRRDRVAARRDGKQTRCTLKSSSRLHDCKTLAAGSEEP